MDEAGTSAARDEKCCVVAAVIAHADNDILLAEKLIEEALLSVPSKFRSGFVFHAESIMNDPKYRDDWRLTDRVDFLRDMMSIPLRLQLGIAYGQHWADATEHLTRRMASNVEQHLYAFQQCVAYADRFIRERCSEREIGTIVAEQHDSAKLFNQYLAQFRENPLQLGNDDPMAWRAKDVEQGYNSQSASLKVTRIRKTIHFVGKNDDDMVWLADAVAYGLKRFFGEQKWGLEFGLSIHGGRLNLDDFKNGPMTGGYLNFSPQK